MLKSNTTLFFYLDLEPAMNSKVNIGRIINKYISGKI